MTTLFQSRIQDVTIPSGQAISNTVDIRETAFDAEGIMIVGPAALDAHTFAFQVSVDGGTTFGTLEDMTATNITVPLATKARMYNGVFAGITHLRIIDATGNTAANRTWQMGKAWRS